MLMRKILFLDIECDHKGVARDFGAVYGSKELHERNPSRLREWMESTSIICGHNIIEHDLPILEKLFDRSFSDKILIDTLLWSPLIFSRNPYHKLVKGYKLRNEEELNNPLSDAKLTSTLLNNQLNEIASQGDEWLSILKFLLANDPRFSGMFDLLGSSWQAIGAEDILKFINGKVCDSVFFKELIVLHPVELAYVLSVIRLDDSESIIPKWVLKAFPKTIDVFKELRFSSCKKKSCSYCSTHLNPKRALSHYFSYTDFRRFDSSRPISLQEETVNAGLHNESFVAVFPTGGGKSLTFQLPALMRGNALGELTVVVSPLVSLMKDQVDNLSVRFGINKAVSLNGLLTPLERDEVMSQVKSGFAQILYVSPESLRSPSILRLLKGRLIRRFVIDEAHCLSSWGQDFRVDYLFIADFIKLLQNEASIKIQVSCFTATAKPQVIQDIKNYFSDNLGLDLYEFTTTVGRSNLSYKILPVEDDKQKVNELKRILDYCERPVIIYASRTKKVEELSGLLNDYAPGLSSYFHGKLDVEEKKLNMSSFMSGEVDVMVATSAFGMGVDKDNVHTVIHYNISDSLENYTQEAGRAGRDAKINAKCYVLFSQQDLANHFSLLRQTKLNRKEIEGIWQAVRRLTKYRNKVSQSALEIAKAAGWDSELFGLETRVTTAIAALEYSGFLKRRQNTPRVFADGLLVSSYTKGSEKIELNRSLSKEDKELLKRVLKRIISDKDVRVDLIADRLDLRTRDVLALVQQLRELKILGDSKDLTAFINLRRSKNSSVRRLRDQVILEKSIFDFFQDLGKPTLEIALRELNQNLIDRGLNVTSQDSILGIFDYWELSGFINKTRINRDKGIYKLSFKNLGKLESNIKWRHPLAQWTVGFLAEKGEKVKSEENNEEVLVEFSLMGLRDSNTLMGVVQEESTTRYQSVLLFLNRIKAIKLEGGFMISYNKLNLDEVDRNKRRNYLISHYEKLADFYEQKTQQIHIVGEYAKKSIIDEEAAQSFVNDYFGIQYEDFLSKYFKQRLTELKRTMTPERFLEIVKDLDEDQKLILEDQSSKAILVLAGPGSGKTKVLVHKVAQMLLLEDVKPEQFMMLTFSKAASLEFRYRINALVPEYRGLIKISTFHGFCFELLGQLGDMEKLQNVIQDATQLLRDEEVDVSHITNKSVLLLDEFQDISKEEWGLVQQIVSIAGNIRVFAVGDDDQNIYKFRGASNDHLRMFKSIFQAKQYSLLNNYRSVPSVVGFNNKYLNRIPSRLKDGALKSKRRERHSSVELFKYSSNYFMDAVVNDVYQCKLNGSKAVLVEKNEEALWMVSRLRSKGLKTRLMVGLDGFKVSQLYEIRAFTSSLKKQSNGLILEMDWTEALDQFKDQFRNSLHFDKCLRLFALFDQNYQGEKLHQEWLEFSREIRFEDVFSDEDSSVLVSTIHKVKGKEFDHVWLMHSGIFDERVNYVGCSRAKNSLRIHTNRNDFDKLLENEFITVDDKQYEPPRVLDFVLTHKDINLGSIKKEKVQKTIKNLSTGNGLTFSEIQSDYGILRGLRDNNGQFVLAFSKKFYAETYDLMMQRGFKLVNAKVEYRVAWYDKEAETNYELVLPKVRFSKA